MTHCALYHQSTAPYFLQDRFCVAPDGPDMQRLYFLAGHLNLDGTEADSWKLRIVQNSVNCSVDERNVSLFVNQGQNPDSAGFTHLIPSPNEKLRSRVRISR